MVIVFTQPQFGVLSGGLIECFDKPWHVGVCVTGSLTTTTLLSIPQWVIRVVLYRSAQVSTRLVVVVSTNVRWSDSRRVLFTWTIKQTFSSVIS